MSEESTYWRNFWQTKLSRRRMLQGAAVGGAGLAAAAVIGCDEEEGSTSQQPSQTGAAAADEPRRGGTLTWADFGVDAPHMDPHTNSFAALHDRGPAMIYNRLMMWDLPKYPEELVQIGDLSESFENPEPTTFVFKMRQAAKWQNISPVNGRAVKASDVAFSYQRQVEGKASAAVISAIDKVEAVDDATLRITLKTPDADFLFAVADTRSKIVAPEAVEVNGNLEQGPMIGTGAWIFEDWVPDQALKLKRNPDFWRKGADGQALPYVDRYERPILLDTQTAQAAFRSGQTVNVNTNGQITKLLQQGVPDLMVTDEKLLQVVSYIPILVNPAKSPTNDVRVRQALSLLHDRQQVIRDMLFGSGWINSGVFVPSLDWHLPEAEINQLLGRDVQKAKQLLQAAGVDLNSWTPIIESGALGAGGDAENRAAILQANLKEGGVNTTIGLIDKVEITERVYRRGEYDIYYGSHRPSGGGTNGHLFLFFHSTGTDATFGMNSLRDAELDRMIEEQSVILDEPERRKDLLQRIMRRNIELAVNLPGYTPNGETAVLPRVANLKDMSSEPHKFEEIWFKS